MAFVPHERTTFLFSHSSLTLSQIPRNGKNFAAGSWWLRGGGSADGSWRAGISSHACLSLLFTVDIFSLPRNHRPRVCGLPGRKAHGCSVYALQKSRNGALFLPFLQYDSYQKVIRYWAGHFSACRWRYRKGPGRGGRSGRRSERPVWDPAPGTHPTGCL